MTEHCSAERVSFSLPIDNPALPISFPSNFIPTCADHRTPRRQNIHIHHSVRLLVCPLLSPRSLEERNQNTSDLASRSSIWRLARSGLPASLWRLYLLLAGVFTMSDILEEESGLDRRIRKRGPNFKWIRKEQLASQSRPSTLFFSERTLEMQLRR